MESLYLPLGNKHDNYSLTVVITVRNAAGVTADTAVTTRVCSQVDRFMSIFPKASLKKTHFNKVQLNKIRQMVLSQETVPWINHCQISRHYIFSNLGPKYQICNQVKRATSIEQYIFRSPTYTIYTVLFFGSLFCIIINLNPNSTLSQYVWNLYTTLYLIIWMDISGTFW